MRIKEEYLDITVSCPATGKWIYLRTLELEMYNYYNTHGYEWLFEEEPIKKKLKNDIS